MPSDREMISQSTLTSPDEFLAPCPKFRVLVLGNPESTKQELFSKIFGVDLEKKLVAEAFKTSHDIEQELDIEGQNERLAIYTSPNFGSNDQAIHDRACDFIRSRASETQRLQDRLHCIWYCVASEEERPVSRLEARFFGGGLNSIAPHIPVILVFTKYDEFVGKVQLDWSKGAEERGISKVAVEHILKDITAKRFEKTIRARWDDVLLDSKGRPKVRDISLVCVASGNDADDDDSSFEELAKSTLESLREWKEWHVKLAFAAAQRNSATISTRFCAETAAEYFTVDTGHARKINGVDMRDIVPNFYAKAVKIFNMRDTSSVLTKPQLLERILSATFNVDQQPLLEESLHHSSTEGGIMMGLSPHDRAVMLTQALASIVMFLHELADTQWPQTNSFDSTITAHIVENQVRTISSGAAKRELLDTIENSPIFASCPIKQAIANLISKSVELADRISSPHGRSTSRAALVVDDSDLQEISLSFVKDKSPDDVVLPCGLTILPLN